MVLRAHWSHLANTIELLLPSAHPSPQSKRQIDRFSRSCTAHGRKPPMLIVGSYFPEIDPSHGELDAHLIHGSLGQPKSSTQTLSRSIQPIL